MRNIKRGTAMLIENATILRGLNIYTFIIEWQHKHAGFKTKHNAQSISQ